MVKKFVLSEGLVRDIESSVGIPGERETYGSYLGEVVVDLIFNLRNTVKEKFYLTKGGEFREELVEEMMRRTGLAVKQNGFPYVPIYKEFVKYLSLGRNVHGLDVFLDEKGELFLN